MRKLWAVCIVLSCVASLPAAEPQRWALLIGVDDYVGITDLRFSGRDAVGLAEALRGAGFDERRVFVLHDKAADAAYRPSKPNIERHLNAILSLAGPDDLVIVSFSGHGMHFDGQSYLCPTEADDRRPAESMVAVADVYKRFENCQAALKLLLVDACRNDPRPQGRKSASPDVDRKALGAAFSRPPAGIMVLQSCAEDQISWEDEQLEHGVFMHHVLKGLSGAADGNKNGRVTLGELYEYASDETKLFVANRFPGEIQIPALNGNIRGVFEFPRTAKSLIQLPPSLKGRGPERARSLGQFGGNAATEKAVDSALAWLSRKQLSSGLWSLTGTGDGEQQYSKGSTYENQEAATAMALLAFAGAGNTHQVGEYATVVGKGLNGLLSKQDAEGRFHHGPRVDDLLYTQAQCTMALCELLALTGDPSLAAPCKSAVKYCIDAQDPVMGGWRYRPRHDSDTSVTGWMCMALQSAKCAGLDVPSNTFDRIGSYLDKAALGVNPVGAAKEVGGKYAYQPGMDFDRVMTAEALLCRMNLGWSRDDSRLNAGCEELLRNLPEWRDRDVYYWYYSTQTMFHMEGRHWSTWNGALRDMLVDKQEADGSERGSWDPLDEVGPDLWCLNKIGGRLYVTCFSALMLEVYYRHQPIYSIAK